MGKSLKSKYMKRKRMVKRERAGLLVETPRLHAQLKKLDLLCQGHDINEPRKKNAFRYPDAADAEIPIHEEVVPLDFRAEAMPAASYVHRHGRRKFSPEEKAAMAAEKRVIPEKEAKRLGLLDADFVDVGADVPATSSSTNDENLAENTLSGAVINGVRRKIIKPVLTRKRVNRAAGGKTTETKRPKMVTNGMKKNKALKAKFK